MRRLQAGSLLLLIAAFAAAAGIRAQQSAPPAPGATAPAAAQPGGPAGGPGQGGPPRGPRPKPTNIKALPKDITGDDLIKLMRDYEGQLGVQCQFCHAEDPATHRTNFASDANPMKDTARYMITMTADLNNQYLENLPGRRYADPITCGTCHRGESHPSLFVPKPQQRPAGPGPGAVAAPAPPAKP